MAQSPEFPQYRWVEPVSWTAGRPFGRPLWIVIHTTQGSEGRASAEDGAAYDARRTDLTSTHFFCDQDSTVQCVRTTDRAHAARTQGNRLGIQIEICGRAEQNVTQWQDAASLGTLEQAAQLAATLVRKWDIDVRHLTVAQVAGKGASGFCAHHDITRAFPQDGGTHTDPGTEFPWTVFLNRVREILAPIAPPEDDDMATPEERKAIAAEVIGQMTAAATDSSKGLGFQLRRAPWAYPATGEEREDMAISVFVAMAERLERLEIAVQQLLDRPTQ